MRFLGNKDSLMKDILEAMEETCLFNYQTDLFNEQDNSEVLTLFDAFSGTGAVSSELKDKFNIVINDNLSWATIYSYGRIVANGCKFAKLDIDPFEYFNNTNNEHIGIITKNYTPYDSDRMYLSIENGKKVDYCRNKIESWYQEKLINHEEYCFLLASLIESLSKVANTAGVYGAFLKHWDSRALKPMKFSKPEINDAPFNDVKYHNSFIEDIIEEVECDILYLDPPYTQNQYGTQYHLLETLVLNDNPPMSKITGSRPTGPMRSDWSKDTKVHILLDKIISSTKAKHIFMSYSSNGIMEKGYIEAVLKRYGKTETYFCKDLSYKKYENWKSNNKNKNYEYLFYIEKKEKKDVKCESPLNYIGSKAQLIDDIKKYLPKKIDTFVDIFGGGFNVGINTNANKIVYNDINYFVADIIRSISEVDTYKYIKKIKKYIKDYGLEPEAAEAYKRIRRDYNDVKIENRDPIMLFTIIMYGFQQQIRFNNSHGFNNPVGMRWFNNKVLEKFVSFSRKIREYDVEFFNKDFEKIDIPTNSFVYLDPPYRLTTGSYNDGKRGFNGWDETEERRMFNYLDSLNQKEIPFMLSYVKEHNGNINNQLEEWLEKNNYTVIHVDSIKGRKRDEVLIINYGSYNSDEKQYAKEQSKIL